MRVVGEVFARQYRAEVGEEFVLPASVLRGRSGGPQVGELRARVVGVYETGVVFGDNQVFVPLGVLQAALGRLGEVSGLWVQAADAGQVAAVETAIREALGGRADVLSNQAAARLAAEALADVSGNARLGAAVAGLVGAGVVAFTMALVVRERRTEVGVLKALGASHAEVVGQFVAEAVALAALGALVGLALAFLSGDVLSRLLLGGRPSIPRATFGAATVGWGLLLAAASGIVGSLYPAGVALRLQPAEALRPVE